MRITLLCNAGLAVESRGEVLLIDLPNEALMSFYRLPDDTWKRICQRQTPYDGVCGFYFTHAHPDHYDSSRLNDYCRIWPDTPVVIPSGDAGTISLGVFTVEYAKVDHAPTGQIDPPHFVGWITDGEKSIYLPADAKLDCEAHRAFLKGREADVGFWNAMFLSRPDTRALLRESAKKTYIYHMPKKEGYGEAVWQKYRKNLERYPDELKDFVLMEQNQEIEL